MALLLFERVQDNVEPAPVGHKNVSIASYAAVPACAPLSTIYFSICLTSSSELAMIVSSGYVIHFFLAQPHNSNWWSL